jgi:cell wall-associated NlpC family hydrolase
MRFGRNQIMNKGTFLWCLLFFLCACDITLKHSDEGMQTIATDSLAAFDSLHIDSVKASDSAREDNLKNMDTTEIKLGQVIDTKNANREDIVSFAETLIGVPYRYGSTDPKVGFDCSGFITYVFNHFNIKVPRSSIDFTNVGKEIPVSSAKSGDIILFTGTDSTERFVGHMGIVVSNTDTLRFIHSTSGKQYGVTITPLTKYYQGRFVKTIQIFE